VELAAEGQSVKIIDIARTDHLRCDEDLHDAISTPIELLLALEASSRPRPDLPRPSAPQRRGDHRPPSGAARTRRLGHKRDDPC
jgi:hypothetical protein